MQRLASTLLLLALASRAGAQAPPEPSASAPSSISQEEWHFLGSSFSTPGATLDIVSIGRDSTGGHARVRYKVLALGFPTGTPLMLLGYPLSLMGRGVCLESGFVADSTGRVICDAASRAATDTCAVCTLPLDQIVLTATGYAEGEPYRVGVAEPGGRWRAYVETIPVPVESVVDSMRIHLEMVDAFGLEYAVIGEGFRPGSKIGITTRSGDHSGSQKMIVPADGSFRLEVLPQVAGEPTGFTSVTIDVGHRHLTLEWEWGRGAFKH
jgi:hypothetical protein